MRYLCCWICLLIEFSGSIFAEEQNAKKAEQIGREIRSRWREESSIDFERLATDGVRKIDGKHVILYTDLPQQKQIDELPNTFDQMIPLLCDYFGLDRNNYKNFKVEAFLIDDFNKFKVGGAVRQVPKLRNGYALCNRIWLRNQKSDYYRRHLLLHEGVHAFMGYAFGYWGPPWYREGTAELFATHRWEDGKLSIGVFPETSQELSNWGRIEYVQQDLKKNIFPYETEKILQLGPEDYNENESYAWSWAFAAFCENHPVYQKAFRQTAWFLTVDQHDAGNQFFRLLYEKNPDLGHSIIETRLLSDWQDFQKNICYGYDFKRTSIDYEKKSFPVPKGEEISVRIRADLGWQSSGILLKKDKTYQIIASGQYRLSSNPKFVSEPNGVTVRYCNKLPLGTLLGYGLSYPDKENPEDSGSLHFFTIGSSAIVKQERETILFLRINDFASELVDNEGEATVIVREYVESKEK